MQLFRGPRKALGPPALPAPNSKGPPGESPSRGSGHLSGRTATTPQLQGRAPLSRGSCRNPGPSRCRAASASRVLHNSGGASRLPPGRPGGASVGRGGGALKDPS
ncbi:hypothetical protein NDU88_006040 [Pleurodeles waltl]|uniref:Uncharacterized protein n=1 Tax=Pleurodeles waltl TaxID=8319 RepID=A0AAV7TEE4_PLEWA|nr:hypothetical protein NDU88_006040 [Pleurodeles waltl]